MEVITGKGEGWQLQEVRAKLTDLKGKRVLVANFSDLKGQQAGGGFSVTLLAPLAALRPQSRSVKRRRSRF